MLRTSAEDHAPNDPIVHAGLAVDQNVAKPDDAAQIRNRGSDGRIDMAELIERFADNLQLALYGGTKKLVGWYSVKLLL